MEVSGLFHAPAPLPWGCSLQYPLDKRMGGHQSRAGRKRKILPYRELSPGHVARCYTDWAISTPYPEECNRNLQILSILQLYPSLYVSLGRVFIAHSSVCALRTHVCFVAIAVPGHGYRYRESPNIMRPPPPHFFSERIRRKCFLNKIEYFI
jgi:hypothetical protein